MTQSTFCDECACSARDVASPHGGRAPVAGDRADTSECRCVLSRHRSDYCHPHLYMSLPPELQVLRHIGMNGLHKRMIQCDVKELLDCRAKLGTDLVLLFIAAWLKEPAAIKALANFKPVRPKYTALELMQSLHNVSQA